MLLDFDRLPEVLGYSVIFGVIYFLLYRRFIYSVVDPLFIFVFTTTFGSVLVVEVLADFHYVAHFFVCQFFVFLGFAVVQKWTGNPAKNISWNKVPQYTDILLLRYVAYTLFAIYLASNIFIFYTKGFALLSDNPSSAKVINFQGGFGLFKKINWAVGGVTSVGLIYLYLTESHRRDVILLIIMMLLTALEGSKGALVRYAIYFGLFLYHPAFHHRQELLQRIKRFLPFAIVGVFGIFFTVLSKENDNSDEVILAFIRRLLYGADAVLYFYHPDNVEYFSHFSIWDYPPYLLNPISGFLRLAPYQEAFGNIMVENALPAGITLDVITGPNNSFYTEGQVFFGFFGAFVYSFIVGMITSYLRSLYFSLIKSSAFFLVFSSTLAYYSTGLLTDVRMTIGFFFDTIVLVLPVYVLVCFILRRKFILHRIHFA